MGQYSAEGTRAEGTWTRRLSQDLAGAYGDYVNEMDLRLSDDTQLTLDVTDGDAYAQGSYADALLSVIDDSATFFVQNTAFPYTYTPQRLTEPSFPGDPNLAATRASEAAQAPVATDADAGAATGAPDTGATESRRGRSRRDGRRRRQRLCRHGRRRRLCRLHAALRPHPGAVHHLRQRPELLCRAQ